MSAALAGRVSDCEVFHATFGKASTAILAQFQFGFHPADHHRVELGAVRRDSASESLVIKQLQQRGKALGVAVMRRGGEKEFVLEIRRERADGRSAKRVLGILSSARRGNIVRLVHNQEFVRAGESWLVAGGQRLAEQS